MAESIFGFSSDKNQLASAVVRINNNVATWAITEIGDPKRWYYIKSPMEFVKLLGKPITASAREAYNVIEKEVGLWLKPIVHLDDVDDFGTIEGDVATVSINSGAIVVNAKTVGDGYNGLTIVIANAESGEANKKDISISLNGFTEPVFTDIPTTLTEDAIAILNSSNWVNFAFGTGTNLANGTYTLSGGTKDISLVIDEDFIGSAGLRTGIYGLIELPQDVVMLFLGGWDVSSEYLTAINFFLESTYRNFHFGIKGNFNTIKSKIQLLPPYPNVRFVVGEPYRILDKRKISYDGSSAVVIRNAKKAFFYKPLSDPDDRTIDDGSQGLSQIFSPEEASELRKMGAFILAQDNGIKIASTGTAWKKKGDPFSFAVKTDFAIIVQRFAKALFEERFKSKPNSQIYRKAYFDQLSVQLENERENGFLAYYEFRGDQETPNELATTVDGDTWNPILIVGIYSPLDLMHLKITLENA